MFYEGSHSPLLPIARTWRLGSTRVGKSHTVTVQPVAASSILAESQGGADTVYVYIYLSHCQDSPGRPETHDIDQAGLELAEIYLSPPPKCLD